MSTTSRIIASLSLAAALAGLSTTSASAAPLGAPDDSLARVSPAITVAADAAWAIELTTLDVTPAPPPPPPPSRKKTPEQIAVERARVAATYANGAIPEEALCELTFARGQLLRCDAQLALQDARAAGMPVSVMSDSYRTLEGQVSIASDKPTLAAVPGTSQHGLGLAIDVSGPMRDWLHEHGAEYGWVNPEWAKTKKYEPWHFEYVIELKGAGTTPVNRTPAR